MMRSCFLFLAITSSLLAAGCGGNGLQSVTGTVTFDGKPIEDGRVTFRQIAGDKKAYSAPIVKGEYKIECDPGKVSVEVIASRIIPGKFDNSNGKPEPIGQMYIPARYNSATNLTADVSSSSRVIPFDLKSKE